MPILAGQRLAVLDIETTGWRPTQGDTALEVARVTIDDGAIVDGWASLVGPRRPIPPEATRVHGITEAMLAEAPAPEAVARQIRDACADRTLVFHNAAFDLPFLAALLRAVRQPALWNPVIDTLGLARGLFGSGSNSLGELLVRLDLPREDLHRALGDARTAARILLTLAPIWERDRGIGSMHELAAASQDVMRESARRAAAARRAQASGLI